jgi:hypothetical protein
LDLLRENEKAWARELGAVGHLELDFLLIDFIIRNKSTFVMQCI